MVEVRYFAAARSAMGRSSDHAVSGSIGEILGALADDAAMAVLDRCTFLVDGVATSDRSVSVPTGGQLDVLPPFAGG